MMMEQATMAMATTAAAIATAASTTTAARVATAAATVAAVTGDGHLFTAHKGDADDREKHRDAQNQSTVHPRILQQKNRYLGVTNIQRCRPTFAPAWDGRQARNQNPRSYADRVCQFNLLSLPCVSFADYANKRE
jgi:hypothetical protein